MHVLVGVNELGQASHHPHSLSLGHISAKNVNKSCLQVVNNGCLRHSNNKVDDVAHKISANEGGLSLARDGCHEAFDCCLFLLFLFINVRLITLFIIFIGFSIIIDSCIIIFSAYIAAALRLSNQPRLHLLELPLFLSVALPEVSFSSVTLTPAAIAAPVLYTEQIIDLYDLQFDFERNVPHMVIVAANNKASCGLYILNYAFIALCNLDGLIHYSHANVAEAIAVGLFSVESASYALLHAKLLLLTLSVTLPAHFILRIYN